jgi:hypothetical protein
LAGKRFLQNEIMTTTHYAFCYYQGSYNQQHSHVSASATITPAVLPTNTYLYYLAYDNLLAVVQYITYLSFHLDIERLLRSRIFSTESLIHHYALRITMDNATIGIIIFFLISSYFGHKLLHHVIKTPAQYERPKGAVQ